MTCTTCTALCASRTKIVLPTPCRPGGLIAIGEAPGADEDLAGEGFVGRAGKTLDALLSAHGLVRGQDYGVANIVRCRPPDNRKPTRRETEACLPKLGEWLCEQKPRVLLLVGKTAADAFCGPAEMLGHVQRSRQYGAVLLASDANDALAPMVRKAYRDADQQAIYAIPMPHTSPLSWNRKSRRGKGEPWSKIGAEQVDLAVEALRMAS